MPIAKGSDKTARMRCLLSHLHVLKSALLYYYMYPKHSDRHARTNSADPDLTPRSAASDQ